MVPTRTPNPALPMGRVLLNAIFYLALPMSFATEVYLIDFIPTQPSWMRIATASAFFFTGGASMWLAGRMLGKFAPARWEQREIDEAVARDRDNRN